MKLKKKAVLYAEGMLDSNDRKKFKKKIKKRPDIQSFIKDYKWVEAGLEQYVKYNKTSRSNEDSKELDEEVIEDINKYLINYRSGSPDHEKDFLSELNNITATDKRNTGRIYSLVLNLAASFLFIVLIISAMMHFSKINEKKNIGEQLFKENFQPAKDENILSIKSAYVITEAGKLVFNSSQDSFLDKELNTILRNNETEKNELLVISLALIEKEDFSLARLFLQDLVDNHDPRFYNPARWYLALLEIKLANYEDAIMILSQLCESKNSYAPSSCELLKSLDKNNID